MGNVILETSAYLGGCLVIQSFVFLLVATLMIPSVLWVGGVGYVECMASFAAFNVALVVWGLVGNYVWTVTAVGTMYFEVDPMVSWLPYVPFTGVSTEQWGDVKGGLRNGATLEQLEALWWATAWPVWLAAVATWIACRRWARARGRTLVGWLQRPTADAIW